MPPLRARRASLVTLTGSCLSRSYACILPSSLTIVHSIALVFSTYPPVSVWGTGTRVNSLLGFSRQHRISDLAIRHRYHVSGYMRAGFAWTSPYTLTPGQPSPGFTYLPASPYSCPPRGGSVRFGGKPPDSPLATRNWNGRGHGGTGISTSCASTTPLGLALAPDSPWED